MSASEPATIAALGPVLAQERIRHVDFLEGRPPSNNEVGLTRDGAGFLVTVTDERRATRYSAHHDVEADACRDFLFFARADHRELEALRKAGLAYPQG